MFSRLKEVKVGDAEAGDDVSLHTAYVQSITAMSPGCVSPLESESSRVPSRRGRSQLPCSTSRPPVRKRYRLPAGRPTKYPKGVRDAFASWA